MSKNLTNEELNKLITKSIEKLTTLINDLKSDENDKRSIKKASLIAYWLIDYVGMLRKEKSFDSTKLLKYKRGCIVSVNFGYRIGSELGGKHFAIVLDNFNSTKSDVLTVLPLTSKKSENGNNCFSYELKQGLYELHNQKFNRLIQQCAEDLDEINHLTNSGNPDLTETLKSKIKKLGLKIAEAELLKKDLNKLKNGTLVNIGQITTISKLRILNPKQASDSLNKIKVCPEDLDAINEKIRYLYLNQKEKDTTICDAFIKGVNCKN